MKKRRNPNTEREKLKDVVRICEGVYGEQKQLANASFIEGRVKSLRSEAEKLLKLADEFERKHKEAVGGKMEGAKNAVEVAKRKLRDYENKATIEQLKKLNDQL